LDEVMAGVEGFKPLAWVDINSSEFLCAGKRILTKNGVAAPDRGKAHHVGIRTRHMIARRGAKVGIPR
jgi:hypothetical protein